jgi:biopolymer transport protein ExbB
MENLREVIQEFFALGGWTMYAIGGCSVLGGALFLERLYVLWGEHRFLAKILREWRGASPSLEILGQLEKRTSRRPRWFGEILGAGLEEWRYLSPEALREHLEQFRSGALHTWERGVGLLGTLARITPLLGLLGTVLGMIQIFQKLPRSGGGDFGILAEGIWKALFTTAAGLSVAIPLVLAQAFLLSRVDALEEQLQELLRLLWRGLLRASRTSQASRIDEAE